MKGYFVIAGIALYVLAAWNYAGAYFFIPEGAKLGAVDVHVPKACVAEIMKMTDGRSQYKADIGAFLALKEKVEACGGSVTMEIK